MRSHILQTTRLKFVVLLLCIVILVAQAFLTRPALAEETSAPHLLTPTFVGEPVAVSWNNPKKTHVFAISDGGSIWTRILDGTTLTWGNWMALGVPATWGRRFVKIDAVSWTTSRIDLFGVDNEGIVWHRYLINTTWLPQGVWEDIGGNSDDYIFQKGIQAVAWAPGRLDIFTDHMGGSLTPVPPGSPAQPVYHKAWLNNGWWPGQTSWYIGDFGNVALNINVTSWGAHRLDVVGVNQSGNILHKAWNGSNWVPTANWTNLNFQNGSDMVPPFSVSWGLNRLDAFARGNSPNNDAFHRSYNGSNWSGSWKNLGGNSTRKVTGHSWGSNRIDLFEVRTSGVYHKAFANNIWYPSDTGWGYIGGEQALSDIAVTSWGANRLDLFAVRSNDGSLWHLAWDGTAWTPTIDYWELLNP